MKINKDLNYYNILGLYPKNIDPKIENYKNIRLKYLNNLTNKDIKNAYRKLSKIHHPDKKSGDDTHFTKIVEAYKILSNEKLRSEYDEISQFGRNYNLLNELYEFEFSNESVEVDNYKKSFEKFKKKDLVDILIKIDKFTEIIEYERFILCKKCDGIGQDFSNENLVFECDLCEGIGEWKDDICPSCKGNGETSIQKCGTCEGEKTKKVKEKIKLKKSYFKEGKCRFEFKGNASKSNLGKVGHLYVIIEDDENK